jgi:hypothetical protein
MSAIVISLLITACPHSSSIANKDVTCPGEEISLALAGRSAIDCGIIAPKLNSRAQERAFDCAVDAIGSGRAFRFGTVVIDDGSLDCNAIVSNKEGESWQVTHQHVFQRDGTASGVLSRPVVLRCDDVGVGISRDQIIFVEGFECENNDAK